MSVIATRRTAMTQLFFALLIACAVAQDAIAATVSVGNSGCQYTGLQAALDALGSQPGSHTLKLKSQTIAIPNGVVLDTSTASYTFIGGHANCGDAQPTAGQRTILDATGGNNGTAFAINGSSSASTPNIIFRRITITGGSSETGPFDNPEGGGMELRGRLFVLLEQETYVEANRSGRGAGVYLRGDNASERVTLRLRDASEIVANEASSDGGGIYCADHGIVQVDGGQVALNVSGSAGGGIHLAGVCSFDVSVQVGQFAGLNANVAAGAGGGLYQYGNGIVSITGSSSHPFWIIGNRASSQGGGVYLSNDTNTRSSAAFRGTIIKDNAVDGGFGAAIAALGPIEVLMTPPVGSMTCAHLGVGLGACSAIIGNRHTSRVANVGGVVHLAALPARFFPDLVMRRTLLSDNYGRSMITSTTLSDVDLSELVITGNRLNVRSEQSGTPAAIVQFESSVRATLKRSTLVGNTADGAGGALLDYADAFTMDISGNILHNPGLVARTGDSPANVVTGNCILTHQAGAFEGPVVVADPQLAADMTPSATSPALDRCNPTGVPADDFRGRTRVVDQPTVANGTGVLDLGAIERPLDPPPAAPNLVISRSSVVIPDGSTTPFFAGITDFGVIALGSGNLQLYLLRNTGGETLEFSAHNVSGACTDSFSVAALPGDIAAGATGIVGIRFDPVRAGECIVTYQVFSNDPDNSPYDFQLRGVGLSSELFSDGFE